VRGSRTENRSDRPSRRLHRWATHAPAIHGMNHAGCTAEQAPRRAGAVVAEGLLLLFRVGATPAAPVSRLKIRQTTESPRRRRSERVGLARKGLLLPGLITPKPPQGGCEAGPSHITRHYAPGPHAALVIATRVHNRSVHVTWP
jgi:hypothetical protein